MNITFEQLFYGRGARGYAILGASPGAADLISRVEALCGAVGTPSGDYSGEPFLMSIPDGGRVIMFCGRRGTPDSMGRATLFFHVLVAEKDALSVAKADAFSLFEQGAFADKIPAGDVTTLSFDVTGAKSGTGGHPQFDRDKLDVTLPCIFRSEKPATNLVRNAVGNRVNELAWTTFAFQLMQGFDIQVLPPRVQGLQTANEYDASGRLVYSAATMNLPRKEEEVDRGKEREPSPHYSNVSDGSSPEKSNVMFKFSIFANLVLVAVCAVLLVSRKPVSDSSVSQAEQIVVTNFVERVVEKRVVAPMSDEQRTAIEKTAIARFRSELRGCFPNGKEIRDFDERVVELPKYEDICTDSKFVQQKALLDKLKAYVDFVNKNLLRGKDP